MAFESITDDEIGRLLLCPKKTVNPQSKKKVKPGHDEFNYDVRATDGSGLKFKVYTRQNTREGMQNDFSCGIMWLSNSGESLTLKRCNGSSHPHTNDLDKVKIGRICHIHTATERYIRANMRPENHAETTTEYFTLQGALHYLVTVCNIVGIATIPDDTAQTNMFK